MQETIISEEQKMKGTYELYLPNVIKYGFVTLDIVKKLSNNLEMYVQNLL